mgnify:CR=1 FL=1
MTNAYYWLTVAVIAAVTIAIRFLPFLIFKNGRSTPKLVEKLGQLLPYSVMGMLVVYCLKEVRFTNLPGFLPELIAAAVVCGSYIWKRNTLISIISGTLCYMVLVQFIF